MSGVHSWREVEAKVSDLRSETFDSIAGIILDLEAEVESLRDQVEKLTEAVADLEAGQ